MVLPLVVMALVGEHGTFKAGIVGKAKVYLPLRQALLVLYLILMVNEATIDPNGDVISVSSLRRECLYTMVIFC